MGQAVKYKSGLVASHPSTVLRRWSYGASDRNFSEGMPYTLYRHFDDESPWPVGGEICSSFNCMGLLSRTSFEVTDIEQPPKNATWQPAGATKPDSGTAARSIK